MKTFIADEKNKQLVEKKPNRDDYTSQYNFACDIQDYQSRAPISYPASFLTPADEGKEFELGKDFELQHQCLSMDYITWVSCSVFHYECMQERYRRIIAVPIPAPAAKEGEESELVFTEDDLDNCWAYHKSYLIDILNGEYDVEKAREDLRGLVGSKFDKRTKNKEI